MTESEWFSGGMLPLFEKNVQPPQGLKPGSSDYRSEALPIQPYGRHCHTFPLLNNLVSNVRPIQAAWKTFSGPTLGHHMSQDKKNAQRYRDEPEALSLSNDLPCRHRHSFTLLKEIFVLKLQVILRLTRRHDPGLTMATKYYRKRHCTAISELEQGPSDYCPDVILIDYPTYTVTLFPAIIYPGWQTFSCPQTRNGHQMLQGETNVQPYRGSNPGFSDIPIRWATDQNIRPSFSHFPQVFKTQSKEKKILV